MKIKENNIYAVIKPFYLFCKIFGVLPYTLINRRNTNEYNISTKFKIILKIQKKDYIIIGIQVVFLVITIMCFVFEIMPDIHDSIYIRKESVIDSFSYFLQLSGLNILIISNIIVAYLNKENIENLFHNIYQLDYHLQQLKFLMDHTKTLKFGKKLLTIYVINCILTTIPDYLNDPFTNFLTFIYFFAQLGSVAINCFCVILCFDAKEKFALLKEGLNDLRFQQKDDQKLTLTIIMRILKIYRKLTNHCTLLNFTMNVMLLADVLNAFLSIVTTVYYNVFIVISETAKEEFNILWILATGLHWNVYNLSFILIAIRSFSWIVEQVFINILTNYLAQNYRQIN